MPSEFDADFEAAAGLLTEAFGVPVSITRGGGAPHNATAEVTTRQYTVEDEEGVPEVIHVRDYLIARSGYQVEGVPVDPLAGDRITETINGQPIVFAVLPLGKLPAAQWANSTGTRWLIHTKRVV